MKKIIYILSFITLGVLLQFLLHALIESWYIGLLMGDFGRFSLGLTFDAWVTIHNIFTVLLFFLGVLLGFWQGKYWWPRLYDDMGNRRNNLTK